MSENTASHPEFNRYTQQLLDAVGKGKYPTDATRVAFGITSQEHFKALGEALTEGRITPLGLDRMVGKGKEITRAVGQEGMTFDTGWYELLKGKLPEERARNLELVRDAEIDVER